MSHFLHRCPALSRVIATKYQTFDVDIKFPLRQNLGLHSSTLNVVVKLAMAIMVVTCICSIGSGICSIKPTQDLNARLIKIDVCLHSFSNFKVDRITSRIMATIPLFLISALIETTIIQYFLFYGLFFVMLGFHVLYCNTALGLGRRFQRLNTMLKSIYLPDGEIYDAMKTETPERMNTEPLPKKNFDKTHVDLLKSFADNYESLGKCVEIFSNTYGIPMVFVLASCVMHIVVNAYFLFLASVDKNITCLVCDQAMWIVLHVLKLLLVVESCHMANAESKKTIAIMSEIRRTFNEPLLAVEIEKFLHLLLAIDVEYSALGLCAINRNLLTSVSSTIATYLVILIQFPEVKEKFTPELFKGVVEKEH
ncbi:gustatory receptor for sugar taste 43a-like [Anastrepha obliqua]|uniref:gustatory receptor for sugar taste 43a-like n=1 Tax=Anastrepha obliqua TaxID=95512 RepID=UPI0024094ABB|nr:gustatory receptor for sugar taste 43a-like [Anastrepha obliqua]